jgi:hypothetical protein
VPPQKYILHILLMPHRSHWLVSFVVSSLIVQPGLTHFFCAGLRFFFAGCPAAAVVSAAVVSVMPVVVSVVVVVVVVVVAMATGGSEMDTLLRFIPDAAVVLVVAEAVVEAAVAEGAAVVLVAERPAAALEDELELLPVVPAEVRLAAVAATAAAFVFFFDTRPALLSAAIGAYFA